jgi:hypothetical protein
MGPNTVLCILLSNTLNLCTSHNVRAKRNCEADRSPPRLYTLSRHSLSCTNRNDLKQNSPLTLFYFRSEMQQLVVEPARTNMTLHKLHANSQLFISLVISASISVSMHAIPHLNSKQKNAFFLQTE